VLLSIVFYFLRLFVDMCSLPIAAKEMYSLTMKKECRQGTSNLVKDRRVLFETSLRKLRCV